MWALVIWTFGLAIAPIQAVTPPTPDAVVLWVLTSAAALAGAWLVRVWPSTTVASAPPSARAHQTLLGRVLGVGLVGLAALYFDRYVLRGAPIGIDLLAVRDVLEDSSATAFSSVASLLGAFSPFGLIAVWMASDRGVRVSIPATIAAAVSVGGYVLFSVAAGSRSVLLVVTIIHVAGILFLRRRRGESLQIKQLVVIGGALSLVVLISAVMMLWRLADMGVDPMISIEFSGYAEAVQPSPPVFEFLESNPDFAPLVAAIFSLVLYVFHGFFEFSELVSSFADVHTGGRLLLWLPLKALSIVIGDPDINVDLTIMSGVRVGIFTTFVGPLFIDFGSFAPVVALPLFALLSIPARLVSAGDDRWLPAATTVVAIAVLCPVVDLVGSAAGMYLLVAGSLIPLLAGSSRPRPARSGRT